MIRSKWDIPIHWVIQYVLNDGLIKAFNAISGVVHGPHVDPVKNVPWAGMAKRRAAPGYGGGDQHLALLEAGETVVSQGDSRPGRTSRPSGSGSVRHRGLPAGRCCPGHPLGLAAWATAASDAGLGAAGHQMGRGHRQDPAALVTGQTYGTAAANAFD